MVKNDLKIYEAPTSTVVELTLSDQILVGSPETNPFDDSTEPTPGLDE